MKEIKKIYSENKGWILGGFALIIGIKYILPLLKQVLGMGENLFTGAVSLVNGLTPLEQIEYQEAAAAVAHALGTHKDDYGSDTWTEDELTAYNILKRFKDNLTLFQVFYSKETGGRSIRADLQKYFTGHWAKYLKEFGI